MLPLLARCGTVRVWVVHVGTENLSSAEHGGLEWEDLRALEKLVRALLRVGSAGGGQSEVLLTWLFGRRDADEEVVWRVNQGIKDMGNLLMDRICWEGGCRG